MAAMALGFWLGAGYLVVSLLLAHLPLGAHGQVAACQDLLETTGSIPEDCGRAWGITNAANVRDYWEVVELRMYWDFYCQIPLPHDRGTPFVSDVMIILPNHTAELVFDGDVDTYWSANCRALQGGCEPQSRYAGLDMKDIDGYRAYIEPGLGYAQVNCIEVFQGRMQVRTAQEISVVVWLGDPFQAADFVVVSTYDSMMGGGWMRRPAAQHGLWRLWNVEPTVDRWAVSEVLWYSDVFCTDLLRGVPISSNSYWPEGCINERTCELNGPGKLSDGTWNSDSQAVEPDPEGTWIAGCLETQCESYEAWIGIDLSFNPTTVQCIRILQPRAEANPSGWIPWSHTTGLYLQEWVGWDWRETKAGFGLWPSNPIDGFQPGVWNDTRPAPGAAWHVSSPIGLLNSWRVNELLFHETADCSGLSPSNQANGLVGLAIHSNPSLPTGLQTQTCNTLVGSCADLAFDRRVGTAWESSCAPCGFEEAWIGMKMNQERTVRCFQLNQDASPHHSTASVRVLEWNGIDWESRWTEVGFGSGSWNSRPAMANTLWRIVALSDTELPWTVTDVITYTDTTCITRLEDTVDVTYISSGSTFPAEVGYAFDGSPDTDWIAGCVNGLSPSGEGCAAGAAWFGIQAPEPIEVGCLQLYQAREPMRQSFNISMEYWDGSAWTASGRGIESLVGLGGGAWQVLPGSFASMWRLHGVPAFGSSGFAVSELQLYTNPTCSGMHVDSSGLPGSKAKPISSGWATATEIEEQTGYRGHYPALGMLGTANPARAFDEDLNTFWVDLGASFDRPGWIGTDFQVQVATIQCVRVAFAPVWNFQAEAVELQVWTGSGWASQTVNTGALPSGQNLWQNQWAMPLLGAAATGWVQRPVSTRLLWRVQTDVRLRTWVVRELEMYSSPTCGGEVLPGSALSSTTTSDGLGHGGHDSPQRAFDGDISTYWQGDCIVEGESTICSVGRMWIGLHLLHADDVRCIRLYQSGRREFQASSVRLATWQGEQWQALASYHGLGGSSWQQRPAPPDSLWRIVYNERRDGCDASTHQRSWGVSELRLFADEDCTEALPGLDQGAVPIASGTPEWRLYSPDMAATWSHGVEDAFDGNDGTYWRAHCATPGGESVASCEDGQEWIGLDFTGTPGIRYEVRCFQMLQARDGGSECCDPAAAVHLHRWNGVEWVAASWRHLPHDASPVHIDANFSGFATCSLDLFRDAVDAVGQSRESTWEERSRRESETCAFEKSEATTLIADPLCEKHSRCADAGFVGFCCPLRSGRSRCCCNFMKDEKIFEDELELDSNLNPEGTEPEVGYEYIVIRSSLVMPWMGLAINAIIYVLGNLRCPQSSVRLQKAWLAMCAPVQAWLNSDTVTGRVTSFFVCKRSGESRVARPLKAATWLTLGFFVGGCTLWIVLSWAFSEAAVKFLLTISKIMRYVKSPYDMLNEADKQRMVIVLAIPYAGEPVKINFAGASAFAKSLVEGAFLAGTTLIRSIFDAIVLRFAMLSVGLVDIKVSVSGVVENLPSLPSYAPQIFDYLYEITSIAAEAFTEFFLELFEGVPRCQGPIRIFCSMFMLFITLVYMRFFNFDYFGLFVTAIETAKASRPTFQKTCFVVCLYGAQALATVTVQCMMLVFARGIVYAVMTVEGSSWNGCPYEEEAMSILVGQVFLYCTAAFAVFVALLCANGHLLGAKFLIKDFEKSVQVHFYENDEAEDNAQLRTQYLLSMIPTTMGIWIDGWNVDGFRIKERANNLAKEMKYPNPCPECGIRHVPYNRIMKASGVQLSLAYQAVPFGALLGKACEYLNNPPLVYIGTDLPCFWENRHLAAAREGVGKKEASRAEKSGLFAAWCKDRLLQVLRRIPGPLIFAALVYFTFAMTEENMADMAMELFSVLSGLAACQAVVEIILPTLIIAILVVVLVVTKRRSQVESVPDTDELGRPRPKVPLVGFVLHGTSLGLGAFIYMWHEDVTFNVALFPGFLVAIVAGSSAVFLSWLCQVLFGSIGSRFFIGCYAILVGVGSGWLMSTGMELPMRFTVIICVVGLVLVMTVVTLAPHQRKEEVRSQVVSLKQGSPLMRLLHTWRFLSGSLGSMLGIFAAAAVFDVSHRNIEGSSWDYVILLLSGAAGLILGVAYSMGVDMMIKTKAGRWALLVGNVLSIAIGAIFPWAIGVVIGSVVGCIVGAVLEGFLLRSVKQAQFPLQATSKANFKEVKSRGGEEADAYQKQTLPVIGGPAPEPPALLALPADNTGPVLALDDAQSRTSDADSETAPTQALALVGTAENTPASSAKERTQKPQAPAKKKRYTMGQAR